MCSVFVEWNNSKSFTDGFWNVWKFQLVNDNNVILSLIILFMNIDQLKSIAKTVESYFYFDKQ